MARISNIQVRGVKMGFSIITGDPFGTVMHADNCSFDGTKRAGVMGTNGQLWIGSAASPRVKVGAITSPLGTIAIGYSSPNITIDLVGTTVAVDSIAMQTGTSPVVPDGSGLWTLSGATVAAGTHPIRSDGAGPNTSVIEVQISQAIAATDATKIGLSNFDSAAFDVDANGFVQLNGGGIAATAFDVQANTAPGTDPVVPSAAGVVIVNGAAVANHSVVLETRSRAVNTYNLEVQYGTSAAATDATKSGVAHFNSAQFSVDANGFVSTSGTGVANTITGNSGGALSPTAGNWNIFGASTAAGTSPVSTSGAVSTLTVNVQKSQAIAATDATKVGLANFSSTMFAVDANGFVTLAGGGQAIDSIAVQTGTSPIAPTAAGLVTINGATVAAGTNPVRTDGTGANTMAVEVQFSQAIASTDATKVGLSNFNSAQFSVDANGFVSTTAAISQVKNQTFTSNGTYTPTSGMKYCQIIVLGGGAAGGGAASTAATSNTSCGSGGGAGEYASGIFTAAQIGASKAVTVGAGGTGVSGGTGNSGGATSVGATLISANGGTGGISSGASLTVATADGGAGGTGGTAGDYRCDGYNGGHGVSTYSNGLAVIPGHGGDGGNSYLGPGGKGALAAANGGGGHVYGAGGGGALTFGSTANTGGAGTAGIVIITEYI